MFDSLSSSILHFTRLLHAGVRESSSSSCGQIERLSGLVFNGQDMWTVLTLPLEQTEN